MDQQLPAPLNQALLTLLRYAIVSTTTFLVAHKAIDQGTASAFTDPAMIGLTLTGIVTAVYGAWIRIKAHYLTKVALQMPADSSLGAATEVAAKATVGQVLSK